MLSKRGEERDNGADRAGELAAIETMRSAGESAVPKPVEKKDEEHVSLFWRVFGGTILSIVALGAVTLWNSLSSGISDLRSELNKEREARAGLATALVKKEDYDTRVKTLYERIREVQAYKVEIEGLRERANGNAAAIDGIKRDAGASLEAIKRDTAGLEVLRERVAGVEALRKDVATLDVVKEKLTAAVADLKTVRDELTRVQQDLERNKASDLERKSYRDAQAKQAEETLKELQKAMQDCREKLARLEAGGPVGPAPKQPRTTTPVGTKSDDPRGDGATKPVLPDDDD